MPLIRFKVTGKYAHVTASRLVDAHDEAEARRIARRLWRKGTRVIRVERQGVSSSSEPGPVNP